MFSSSSRLFHLLVASALVLSFHPVRAEHEGKLQILLLGDSTTEGSIPRLIKPEGPHLEEVLERLLAAEGGLPPCHVINSGVSGEFVRRLLDGGRYDKEVRDLPGIDWIFIRYGLNDRAKLDDFESEFPRDLHELIAKLREDHPGAKIVMMTVIPFSGPEASEAINAHNRAVAEKEKLPLFDIYPRYAEELEKGRNMLNYRRFPVEKVPEKYRAFVEPFVIKDRVVVMSNELDGILGHLGGWFGDRHPNLAGYNVIADETAKWLVPRLKEGGTSE